MIILKRFLRSEFGIFSTITDNKGLNLYGLEHSYPKDNHWITKVPEGIYTCQLGIHELSDLKPFQTYEVENVPNHTGILFHIGNYNKDSSGCILLGTELDLRNGMILNSRVAFDKFMNSLAGQDSFELMVESV